MKDQIYSLFIIFKFVIFKLNAIKIQALCQCVLSVVFFFLQWRCEGANRLIVAVPLRCLHGPQRAPLTGKMANSVKPDDHFLHLCKDY